MSALKTLPRRRRIRTVLGICMVLLGCFGLAASYLKKLGLEGSTLYLVVFIAFAMCGVLLAFTGRPFRCPDCGQFLREGAEHPRASETYLYYCKRCDVIWDTMIERSNV